MAFLAVVDSLALLAMSALLMQGSYVVLGVVLVVTVLVNIIYLRSDLLPAKYLTPGLIFLAIFQIFVVAYSGYIAFTNYGDGHNGSKEQAIGVIETSGRVRVADSPTYPVTILDRDGELAMLITGVDGTASVGTAQQPLQPVSEAIFEGGKAVGVEGARSLAFSDLLARQSELLNLEVPLTDDPGSGALRTPDGTSAYLYDSVMVYDEATDTFTDSRSDTVYFDSGDGAYESADGQRILPGWKINVGLDNFVKAATDTSIRGPLLSVTVWTFVFAFLSVATTFALGLALALLFNDERMRGRKVYRVLVILPYAFPGFLSGLVWMGMLNQDYGFVNQVIFGGAEIPWLTDPWIARFSVLFVNLWLGFPYMFLITTGALQAIPTDILEAGRVDGASPWQVFRRLKLPLLMVSVAPVLIAAFAFNFNNFNVIYMLTGGGPRDISAGVDAGATDLLITLVYKVAFGSGTGRDYGLASAFAIIIFVIVAVISALSFRRTKVLEEIH